MGIFLACYQYQVPWCLFPLAISFKAQIDFYFVFFLANQVGTMFDSTTMDLDIRKPQKGALLTGSNSSAVNLPSTQVA